MYKPSDAAQAARMERFVVRLALSVALLAPLIALAGVAALEAGPAPAPAAKPAVRPATPVQIRCWQDGRLLFEESSVHLPEGSQYGAVIAGTDRDGRPVYLAETRNATCLIRQAAPERPAWAR